MFAAISSHFSGLIGLGQLPLAFSLKSTAPSEHAFSLSERSFPF